ncbi:MAG: hypothetical protein ABJB11_00740 [Ferruginibacter sp.]
MPTPIDLKAPIYPDCFYHVVFKSIDGLLLFNHEKDHCVFQDRFKKFLGDFVAIWSFCLIPNHTHFVLKIKSRESINLFLGKLAHQNLTVSMKAFIANQNEELLFNAMIERQVNSFMVSYANYVNNKFNRKGGIFQKPFKRIKIEDESHLQQAIIYTNANAQKHDLVNDFKTYSFSSYPLIIANDHYFIDAKSVIEFFESKEKFIRLHQEQVDYFYGNNWPSSKLE